MQPVILKDLVAATSGTLVAGSLLAEIKNICTDSRKISEGDLFIPLKGERFDGHEYISAAFEKGAAGCLTSKNVVIPEGRFAIQVEDTLKSFGDIARFYRSRFSLKMIAITGSVGKTSTKDMVAAVLSGKYNVLKTEGNFNNEIGLPQTLLNIDKTHQAAVVEMGMRGLGEIRYLTSIARPDIAVITNIGLSHIERLGSRQNILKAKLEIIDGLPREGIVVLNGDDEMLSGLKGQLPYRVIFYGLKNKNVDYAACNVRTDGDKGTFFDINICNREYNVRLPVPGIHNVYNALAAIAAGMEIGMEPEEIIGGLAAYTASDMRLSIKTLHGITIINDAYNASPSSMEAALSVLKELGEKRRTIAVLADMLELGEYASEAHYNVGRYAAINGIDNIIATGTFAEKLCEGALAGGIKETNVKQFDNNNHIIKYLESFINKGDVILVKGSRAMKMEEIADFLYHFSESPAT